MKSKFIKKALCTAMALCMSAPLVACREGNGGGNDERRTFRDSADEC